MSEWLQPNAQARGLSICLFCGSSDGASPRFLEAAAQFGATLASEGVRLVYGGGGVGLMGAAARAAQAAGGDVLGVMPEFLLRLEALYEAVPTQVVGDMHERKRIMFEQSDGFAVLPGGVGTLEEVVELLSWRRLDLHRKPIVFLDLDGFWQPLYALIQATVEQKFSPKWIPDVWDSVTRVEDLLPALLALRAKEAAGPGFFGYAEQNAEVASKA